MSPCTRYHSQYFYHASAYGVAAEIQRPIVQSIPAQAATALSCLGGRGSIRMEKFTAAPFISFEAAYSEVGGSFDDCHGIHTTYASAVIEKLNIFDVVRADRVVSRMVVYSPEEGAKNDEHSFSLTGSHFDNLRIAGHHIDVKLATPRLHQHDTYTKFEEAYHDKSGADLLPWGNQNSKGLDELEKAEETYHALRGLGKRAKAWKQGTRKKGVAYWCSAAGHLNLADLVKDSEMVGFGAIILIPKFGIVRLADLIVEKNHRRFTMINVQMCSGTMGGASGGGTTGGDGVGGP